MKKLFLARMRAVETMEQQAFDHAQSLEDELAVPKKAYSFGADSTNIIFEIEAQFEKTCAALELKGFSNVKDKTVIEFEGCIEVLSTPKEKAPAHK